MSGRIVIFGATGNIGVYLVDYFAKELDSSEFEVIAVGRRETDFFSSFGVDYIKCDITNPSDFAKLPCDNIYAVVNATGMLPAYTKIYDPFEYIETNISGGIRILEYARKTGADRILYTQTWAAQGGYWGKEEVLSPDMGTKIIYTGDHAFYTITKTTVVEAMEHYKQEYGLKNFVFRLPNVYMWHPDKYYYVDGEPKLVAYRYMIERAEKGEPIELWGNPNAFKDILYVKDLCQMMYRSLFASVNGGTYNAGTGIRTSLREQIDGIIEVFCPEYKKSELVMKPSRSGFVSFVMDIEKLKTDLGYVPRYSYLEYLRDYKKEKEMKRFDSMWEEKRRY